jgi:hypothetical protein
MSDFQSWVSDLSKEPGFAGMCGALLSLKWMPGTTWMQKFFAFGGGMSVAFFLVPYAVEFMSITSDKGPAAMGFIGGFIGFNLLGKGYEYVAQTTFGELLSRFWSKRT